MEKRVEFDITIKNQDMYDFLMKHFYSTFSGKFGIVLSVGALVFFFLSFGKRDVFQMTILLILGLLFTVIQPLQMKMKAAAQVKTNPMLKEPIHFLFDDKGMTVSQKAEKAFLPWEEVRRVKESKRSVFVYMTAINANIIPKEQLGENLEPLKEILKEHVDKSVYYLK